MVCFLIDTVRESLKTSPASPVCFAGKHWRAARPRTAGFANCAAVSASAANRLRGLSRYSVRGDACPLGVDRERRNSGRSRRAGTPCFPAGGQ